MRDAAKRLWLNPDDRGGTMPSQRYYKDHLLISIARYDSATGSWVFKVNVSWWEKGNFHYQIIDGPSGLCKTEEEAISQGFSSAQLWIDKKL